MDPDEIQRLLAQNRVDTSQRIANIPPTYDRLRGDVMGSDQTLNSLRDNEASKIQELWKHDQDLSRYADPNQATYLADPYAREKARAIHAQGTVGELTGIQNSIQQRKDTLGDTLEKALQLLDYGVKAKEYERKALESELEAMLKIQERKDKQKDKLGEEKKRLQLSQAIEWILSQSRDRGEAKQDVGAMAGRMPESATEILSLLDLFPQSGEPVDLNRLRQYSQGLGLDTGTPPTAGGSAAIDPDYFKPI